MGVAVLVTRDAVGLWTVWRLQIEAAALPVSRWQRVADRIGPRVGLVRPVTVVESARVSVPTVLGWMRPAILLPFAVATRLTPSQLEAVLAHELAHVRRYDYPMNLFQVAVETTLFYHPVVWWVSSRIRAEREHCCDDIAVSTGGDAVEYAAALVELNTLRATTGTLALAATSGGLGTRVRRLLRAPDQCPRRRPGVSGVVGLAVAAVAGIAVSVSGTAGEIGPFEVGGAMAQAPEPIASPATFDWQIRSAQHVDVYFYSDLAPEVDDIVQAAEQAYAWVSGELAHELDFRVPVVLFKTRADFERQKIAPGADLSGARSFSEPRRNRLVLLVDEGGDRLADLITHEMTHIFMFDLVPRTARRRTGCGPAVDRRGAWRTT